MASSRWEIAPSLRPLRQQSAQRLAGHFVAPRIVERKQIRVRRPAAQCRKLAGKEEMFWRSTDNEAAWACGTSAWSVFLERPQGFGSADERG